MDWIVKSIPARLPLIRNHARWIRRQKACGARDKIPGNIGNPGGGVVGQAVPCSRGKINLIRRGTGRAPISDHHRNRPTIGRIVDRRTGATNQTVLIIVPTTTSVGINGGKIIGIDIARRESTFTHSGRIKGGSDRRVGSGSRTVIGGVVINLSCERGNDHNHQEKEKDLKFERI